MIRVLIVDDEYIMRQGLKYMIHWEQEGYEIVGEATNGNEALRLVEELKPHIIISDIVMSVMDGVTFTEMVHRIYPDISIIILSGYDNFEYVKKTLTNGALDYILKPTLNEEELLKVLDKAAQRIPGYKRREQSEGINASAEMERYLLGLSKELDESAFHETFPYAHFRIFGMRIRNENEIQPNVSELLYQKIKKDVADFADANGMVMILQEELVVALMCCKPSNDEKTVAFLKNMAEELSVLCEYILGVCSRPFDGMKAIRQFYQQDIINYADKIFYYQDRKFILAEDEEAQENKPGEKFDFFKYNKFLSMKEYKDALQLLKEYDVRALEGKQDIAGLKNQMKNMLYYFLDNLALAEEQKDNLRYEYFRRISQARYEKEYRDVMRQIFEDVMMKADIPQKTVDDRIPKMLAFIEDNYAQDLRLEDMAEEFNFNYHYLSAYFHQHMKEGFSDYLNEIRKAKACELLENTTLSIAEISEKVGYSEHSYFCRVFKKITGQTPSVYRRKKYE